MQNHFEASQIFPKYFNQPGKTWKSKKYQVIQSEPQKKISYIPLLYWLFDGDPCIGLL